MAIGPADTAVNWRWLACPASYTQMTEEEGEGEGEGEGEEEGDEEEDKEQQEEEE